MTPDPFWNAFRDSSERERRTPRTFIVSSEERKQQKRIAQLFLRLWDKAVNMPGYEKGEWMELQNFLNTRLPGVFCVGAPLGTPNAPEIDGVRPMEQR